MVLDKIGKNFVLKEYTLNYPKNFDFLIKHYKFLLDIDRNFVKGKAEIFAEGKNVELDAFHFTIKSLKVDGREVSNYYYDGKKIFVPGEIRGKIEIEYEVKPTLGLRLIEFGDHYELATTGEVDQASYWIPVVNYPGMKSTSEFLIRVKKPYIALSNGELKEVIDDGDYTVYHWVMDVPHSSYLNSIAIGLFSEFKEDYNGIILEYYLPKGYEEYLWNLSMTKEAMKFFTSYIGEYPYSRYAQIVLFSMNGGMEYITSTHLTWRVIHDKIADKNYTADSIVSHELAHQWFGDLITTKDWSNIWLNEGFASYFQAMFFEYYKGEEEFLYNLYSKFNEYLEETEKYTRPIVTRYYKWGDELFDRHTYNKGALFLHMLRNYLGDEVFKKGIREYVKRFKYKSVDTEDFKKVMEEVSGKDLTFLFDQFIYSAGHPIVNVTQDGNKISVAVEEFQLEIEVKHNKKIEKIKNSANFEGGYVCVDPKFKALVEVKDNQSEENLILESKDEDLICRIRAVSSLSRFSDIKAIQALKERFNDFWGVAYEAAISLGKIGNEDALNVLAENIKIENDRVKVGIAKALGNFKFNEKAKDLLISLLKTTPSYHVRAEAIVSLGKINMFEVRDEIIRHFEEKSYSDIIPAAVIEALSYFEDDDSFRFVLEKGVRNKSEPIRASAARHLWRFGNRSLDVLRSLLKDPSPIVRGNAIRALGDLKAHSYLKEVVENEDETYANRALALRLLSKSTS